MHFTCENHCSLRNRQLNNRTEGLDQNRSNGGGKIELADRRGEYKNSSTTLRFLFCVRLISVVTRYITEHLGLERSLTNNPHRALGA